MTIHDLAKKWRDSGNAIAVACAEEFEAHLKDASLCYISDGAEMLLEIVLPGAVFEATMRKPATLNISTKTGDTRTASLHFLN